MIPLQFEQANLNLAENQPQYIALPAFYGTVGRNEDETGFVVGFQLDHDDINQILNTKTIFISQMTFGQPFNPINVFAQNPFEPSKEYPKAAFNAAEVIGFGNYVLSQERKDHIIDDEILNSVSDVDFESWMNLNGLKYAEGISARETEMLQMLKHISVELESNENVFRLKTDLKQFIKRVDI